MLAPAASRKQRLVPTTIRLAVILVAVATALSGCQASDSMSETSAPSDPSATAAGECAGTGTVTHLDQQYGEITDVDPALLSLDVYEPVLPDGCEAAPIVVYVHGGSYTGGDKSGIDDKVALFNAEGWVVASVNYRLSPSPSELDNPDRVMYPEPEQDIAAALGWLSENAGEFGGDPHQFFMLGHSAGAFLVALMATDASFVEAEGVVLSDLACTVPLDAETFDMTEQTEGAGSLGATYLNAFGSDPAVWAAASPITLVEADKGIGSFLMFSRGSTQRAAWNQEFADALTAAGSPSEVVSAEPYTHDQVTSAIGTDGETLVTGPLMDFFRGCAA